MGPGVRRDGALPDLAGTQRRILQRTYPQFAQAWFEAVLEELNPINPDAQAYRDAAKLLRNYPDQKITLHDAALAIVSRDLAIPVWTLYQIWLIRYRMVTNQPDRRECSGFKKTASGVLGFVNCLFESGIRPSPRADGGPNLAKLGRLHGRQGQGCVFSRCSGWRFALLSWTNPNECQSRHARPSQLGAGPSAPDPHPAQRSTPRFPG